jgi:hypothetical protein
VINFSFGVKQQTAITHSYTPFHVCLLLPLWKLSGNRFKTERDGLGNTYSLWLDFKLDVKSVQNTGKKSISNRQQKVHVYI